ncbi:MAG: hypothetical protein A2283_11165 [Lentisphaerae bacterium RIFOXYA12_FULL_48_11]|nr:MAG: hypothetical protein A2283_11165 [Lentisphaerae bacterium RIFOXYA12_FULL_48_11]
MHTEREYRIYRSDHNLAEDAILPTDAIQKISAEVDVTMERGRAENKLHNVAQGFWGFLQYILVPLSFLCAIRLATRKGNRTNRIAGIVFIIAIAACGVLMIYRNYLTGFAD